MVLARFSSQDLLQALPHAMVIFDLEGRVNFINQKFTEDLGYQLVEIQGFKENELLELLLKNVDQGPFANDIKELVVKKKLRHKDGYCVPMALSRRTLHNSNGEACGRLMAFTDLHAELLIELTNWVNSSLQLEDILKHTTTMIVDYLGLSSNAVFLYDSTDDVLRLVSCNAFSEEDIEKVVIPFGVGAPGIIAKERRPVYVSNLREDPLIDEYAREKHKPKSSIGYPLIYRGELVGVIAFDAETIREFTPREQQLFAGIANEVAIAIFNAQYISKLEQSSVTDGLTGLYNHRYFQEHLKVELDCCSKEEVNRALIFMDIDFFKNYNDTFGHPQGDELLKGFSRILRESVRKQDTICRYGGEEFAVILSDCSKQEALAIAERIRKACEDYQFFGREAQPGGRVTVSIGVAFYPEASNPQELIKLADQALYKAKKMSRNKVVSFNYQVVS